MYANIQLSTRANLFIMKVIHSEQIQSYRIVTNCGTHAGQSVMHMHWHILSNDGYHSPLQSL